MRNADVWNTSEYRNLFKKINVYYSFYDVYLTGLNAWEARVAENHSTFWHEQDMFEIAHDPNDSIIMVQSDVEKKQRIVQLLKSTKGRNFIKLGLAREKKMQDTY